jgi:peptide chain release factor subunit 1
MSSGIAVAKPAGMPPLEQLTAQLDKLAAFEASPFPVISLYLNLQPDDRGRDRFEPFLRKELADRVRTYATAGPERESLEKDAERIRNHVRDVERSANGLAIFACSGADLFEAIELAAPVQDHRLFISDEPHLYPLARLLDEYPRYLALITDTHSARIFVFAANEVEKTDRVESDKTKRHKKGGWSQARYQRNVDNFREQHAKEVVDTVARIVREDGIDRIIVSGDEVIVPMLRDQMPKEVADKIVDVVRLDTNAPQHEILASTIAALQKKDAQTDRERVDELLGAYRASGLACVGVEDTLKAFELGQVDELVITAAPETIDAGAPVASDAAPARSAEERAADVLIVQARNTSAKVRFIEDASLLAAVGGVGAFLRFKL